MTSISLSPDSRGYTYAAIKGFLDGGWTLRTIPDRGHLLQNRQLVQLAYSGRAELFRLMIYTVSESGRGDPSREESKLLPLMQAVACGQKKMWKM